MHAETTSLMWFIATKEVYEEYGVFLDGTLLESGKHLLHVGLCNSMAVRCSGDNRVQGFDEEGLKVYLEWVDGYAGSTGETE